MRASTVSRGLPMPSPVHATRRRAAAAPAPAPVPIKALALSVLGHVVIVAALVAATLSGAWDRPRVHVVNLVSSIAAVGNPAGSAAPLPARTLKPAAREIAPDPVPREREAAKPTPTEVALPSRGAAKPTNAALPWREVTSRPGQRELPPLSMPSDRRGKTAVEPASRPSVATLGQTTGSVAGQGSLTLESTDFPYKAYLRQVLQKVEERWQTQNRSSEPAQKPRIYVEIRRDGSIAPPILEESSGSSFYDRAALRAVTEASPFPPLPPGWAKSSLRVLFNFDLKHG
ncbi:MAG: TonB family protein [Candidatus Rokubacteria bacterium]|nr:TonB family protein [Candidatus Rokubacteria bacterium]